MRDTYLNYQNSLERLKKDYDNHGQIIIAYDFDNTVYSPTRETYHNEVITLLQKCAEANIAKFICYTASSEERESYIVEYLINNDIPVDMVNKNIIEEYSGEEYNHAKLYYNIFLDDRAGLGETYNLLNDLLNYAKAKNRIK